MQSDDLVSDNSSPTDDNQGEGVQTVSPNDQSTSDNFSTLQESTPAHSTSAPILPTAANVEQTQSFSSRAATTTHVEDHSQSDQRSSFQFSGPNETRAPLSLNEQEMVPASQLREQLTRLFSQIELVGQRILKLEQTTREQSKILREQSKILTSQDKQLQELLVIIQKFFERSEHSILPNFPQSGSQLAEQSVMSSLASTSKVIEGGNRETKPADNTARPMSLQDSSLNNSNVPVLLEGQEQPQTDKPKKRVSFIVGKFEKRITKCLRPSCSSESSSESESSTESSVNYLPNQVASTSVTSREPTSISWADDSVMDDGTSQQGMEPVYFRSQRLSEGQIEILLSFQNKYTGNYYNFERRMTSPHVIVPLRIYSPHKETIAMLLEEYISHHARWRRLSQEELHFLRSNSQLIYYDQSSGAGSASTSQPAGEPNSLASEREQVLPPSGTLPPTNNAARDARSNESETPQRQSHPNPPNLPERSEEETNNAAAEARSNESETSQGQSHPHASNLPERSEDETNNAAGEARSNESETPRRQLYPHPPILPERFEEETNNAAGEARSNESETPRRESHPNPPNLPECSERETLL